MIIVADTINAQLKALITKINSKDYIDDSLESNEKSYKAVLLEKANEQPTFYSKMMEMIQLSFQSKKSNVVAVDKVNNKAKISLKPSYSTEPLSASVIPYNSSSAASNLPLPQAFGKPYSPKQNSPIEPQNNVSMLVMSVAILMVFLTILFGFLIYKWMKVRLTTTPKSSFGRRSSTYETEPQYKTNIYEPQYKTNIYEPHFTRQYVNNPDTERNLTIYNIDIDKLAMNQILDVTCESGCEEEANPHRLTYQSYNDSEYDQNENESSMNSEMYLESIQRTEI